MLLWLVRCCHVLTFQNTVRASEIYFSNHTFLIQFMKLIITHLELQHPLQNYGWPLIRHRCSHSDLMTVVGVSVSLLVSTGDTLKNY